MKKLLSMLTISILVGTSGANLANAKLFTNNNLSSKSSLTTQQNNIQPMKRYDSLNLVDEKTLNNSINTTIKNINKECKDNINCSINGKNYNYKNELLKIFSNKDNLLKTNNKYEQILNNSNNYQKNKLGISFPMNYNGLYFPWWGFGDYFYWYMSSDVYQKFSKAFGWGEAITQISISAFLSYAGIGAAFLPLLNLMLFTLPASFYIDTAIRKFDDGKGVYLGISILPSPIIFEMGNQDKYCSQINSFEVDYKFLSADYIVTCIDEQGINFLLNYYNQKNKNNFVANAMMLFLKQLTPINNCGIGGSITNQDYKDWTQSFVQDDSINSSSRLRDFVQNNKNFRTIDIRTQRSSCGMSWDDTYSFTWDIWKNS